MDQTTALNLICQVVGRSISEEQARAVLKPLSQEDWEVILQVAARQGLTLLLYEVMTPFTKEEIIPLPVHTYLRKTYMEAVARNMRMLHHAKIILHSLKAKDVAVIPLKGLFLVENIYSSIGSRTFGDLDLLVKKSDLRSALAVMQELGYHLDTYYDPAQPNLDIKHFPPMIKQDGPYVEVHWSILEENEPFTIDMEGMWQRARPAVVVGEDVLAQDIEDLLLHLCIHFTYQHRLRAGLKFLVDIIRVAHKYDEQVNWQKLAATAREWGAERVVWLTFSMLEKIFGYQLTEGVLSSLLPINEDEEILSEALRQVLFTPDGSASLTPDLAALAVEKNIVARVKRIFSRIFIPRNVMARVYNVPPASWRIFVYYPVRAYDLFRLYAGSAWKFLVKKENFISLEMEQANGRLREWMTRDRNS